MKRLIYRHMRGDSVTETDVLTCGVREWNRSPHAKDPAWIVARLPGLAVT